MESTGIKSRINFYVKNYRNIIIAAIVIIVVAVVGVVFFFRRPKNIKDTYFQIEKENIETRISEAEKNYNDKMAKTRPFREQPSRTRYELSFKLQPYNANQNTQDFFGVLPSQAIDIINSAKIVLNSRYDIKNELKLGALSLLVESQSFIDINTFQNKNQMGIQVPVIYDKYFVFDNDNISTIFQKFGANIPIKKIITLSDIKNNINCSPSEFQQIFIDYLKFLQENITDDQITIAKGINAETKTSNAKDIFSIKFDELQFKSIAKKSIEYLCTDERLMNKTSEQLYSLFDIFEDAGYFDILDIVLNINIMDEIQKYRDAENLCQNLIKIIENTSFPDGFNMTFAVDKKRTPIFREITLASSYQNEPKRTYNFHIEPSSYAKLKIEQEYLENKAENAIIEIESQKQTGVGGTLFHINCINNLWPDFEAKINTRKTTEEDEKNKTINANYLIDIDFTCSELEIQNANLVLDVKKEDKYGVNFNLPDINEATAIDLNLIDSSGIEALQNDIQFSIMRFLVANQYLLEAFTSED